MCENSSVKTQMLRLNIKNSICNLEKSKMALNTIIDNEDLKVENDFSANDYAKAALINIEKTIKALNQKLKSSQQEED